MEIKPGAKLSSTVCDAQFVVVKAPTRAIDLSCGGAPVVMEGEVAPPAHLDEAFATGSELGKRYADDEVGLEVLCTRAGVGALSYDGVAVPMRGAKPLPASD